MEIRNNSQYYDIPLPVGRRIAQIIFLNTDGLDEFGKGSYESTGKYQGIGKTLAYEWQPSDKLPKMYKDREAIAAGLLQNAEIKEETKATITQAPVVEEKKETDKTETNFEDVEDDVSSNGLSDISTDEDSDEANDDDDAEI
jgi:hypothetical protein